MNPSVFTNQDDVIEVGEDWIARIKAAAEQSEKRRARLIMHHAGDDLVQEMVIAFTWDGVLPPHRSLGKSESVHLVEGAARIAFFDEGGELERVIELAPGKSLMYRLSPEHGLHTLVPLTPTVVVHEVIQGPFDPSATVFPAWAPEEGPKARAFVERALQQPSIGKVN